LKPFKTPQAPLALAFRQLLKLLKKHKVPERKADYVFRFCCIVAFFDLPAYKKFIFQRLVS
jgi:formate hydrogenlyase subunit 4